MSRPCCAVAICPSKAWRSTFVDALGQPPSLEGGGDAMQVAQKDKLTVVPSGGALGAEVRGIDLSKSIDDDTMAEIKEAWSEHLFLCFRAQKLTDDQLIAI